jgi:mono/diheme cytochrome c family protein
MKSDGTRSAWVFESALRQSDGRWRRVREDEQDLDWVHAGRLGNRYTRPAVRPHLCAECHALAGRSPFDGPRGGHEIYSLGDSREMVWAGLSEKITPLLLPHPNGDEVARLARQPRPSEPADRAQAYLAALAKRRHEMPIITRVQQDHLSTNPFRPDDPEVLAAGRQIYLTQCAGCHGLDARGGGPFALRRPAPPALLGLRSSKFLALTRAGSGPMPAWDDLPPGDDLWRIFTFLNSINR